MNQNMIMHQIVKKRRQYQSRLISNNVQKSAPVLPERQNLPKSLRRIRRVNLPPKSKLDELHDDCFEKTLTGNRFLLYHSYGMAQKTSTTEEFYSLHYLAQS